MSTSTNAVGATAVSAAVVGAMQAVLPGDHLLGLGADIRSRVVDLANPIGAGSCPGARAAE
jgi:hypothetical protein